MKIKCSNPGTRAIGRMGETAIFNANGIATVSKSLGDLLVKENPTIEVVKEAARNTTKGE